MNYKFKILTTVVAGMLILSGCGDRPASTSGDSDKNSSQPGVPGGGNPPGGNPPGGAQPNPCDDDLNSPQCDRDNDGLVNEDEDNIHFTDPTNPDTDGDGLLDGEEVNEYHTDPLKEDTDNDGLKDGEEVNRYHTDPTNADTDNDGLTDGEEVKTYHTNPNKADTDNDGLLDGDEVKKYDTDPNNPDTDDDGLTDGDEVKRYKTDPLNKDTDGDTLTDGDEVNTYNTDPTKVDTDDDGLTDGDEVNKYHTDPTKADTDGDGLIDGDEVNRYKTDPLKADTDDDGLNDYEELNTYKTDPLNPDTDEDGLEDGKEVELGSDPLKEDTDGDGVKDGEDFDGSTFTGLEPCKPTQPKGYRGYDYTNSIWQAEDCDGDDYLNGTEDNASLGADHYLSDPYDPNDRCFIFEEKKYCEVDDSNGRIWLDRNLGADRACETNADTDCFGDWYEWGRSPDGHQLRTSTTINETANSWPYKSEYYITSSTGDHDWLTDNNNKGIYVSDRADFWQGKKSYEELKSVCPDGWYVPEKGELEKLTKDDVRERLVVPFAGYRIGDSIIGTGDEAFLWSSTVSNDSSNIVGAWALHYDTNDNLSMDPQYRVNGYQIRCIKKKSLSKSMD